MYFGRYKVQIRKFLITSISSMNSVERLLGLYLFSYSESMRNTVRSLRKRDCDKDIILEYNSKIIQGLVAIYVIHQHNLRFIEPMYPRGIVTGFH